ncbi:type I polyketide synthase [Mycobacterium avium subsp. paratuberculosis K-10]|nr:type I polyketide synthase [Mycobacterium avium]ASE13032.1 KR domain-containing protein [Mycobacterium avium subsp. paratuberculosis]UYB86183.1 type I polyketide synthase [Mycobacterium avium subsp. paratuberculosis K-10]
MDESATPVAVIGMACRLPGAIDSPDALWAALLRGDDFVTEIPLDRWDADEHYDPEPGLPGRSVCRWGAFLDDVGGFDADFFGISEREATAIDPQHRLLLETSWEALEHAGINPAALTGSRTGVFVGLMHDDHTLRTADAGALDQPYGFMGNSFAVASGRIAHTLGLHGPALTVDTACSSGLVSVHVACRSLHHGESDLALAGGATVLLEPRKLAAGSAQGMLSATGRCRAFDAAADGFVSSEGCAMVLLKRLPDALRDGDRILAVVRGTAANQDGRTLSLATPSLTAQTAVYRSALAAAGVDAGTVAMVEAHGTGTPVGDPIEYASLAELYGQDGPCALTSVKTNFGHTQSAAGTLGLVKAVLALQHGVVPQNLHFTRLPDKIGQLNTNLFVPQDNTPWPRKLQQPRRAAVSSYGVSGTNAHAIVEQAPNASGGVKPTPAGPLLFTVSSSSDEGLRETAKRLAGWVKERAASVELSDLAYTLARRRAHRPVRTAVIAGSVDELAAGLHEVADSRTSYLAAFGRDDCGPVWVFSGQGSQWTQMGAELLANEPVFATTVAEVEPLIARESGFSVTEAMSAPHTLTGIDKVQPTIFAMQVALAATMKSYGVRPGAVIGHSLGETAAAVVAGALSLQDGVRVICRRSRLMSRIAGAGAMASVELPAQQVLSELMARGIDDVVVSVMASPTSTVIGGVTSTVRELVAAWEERDVLAREIAVDVASHSPQVDPILDELADALVELEPTAPEVPFYSASLFDPREQPLCDADYWLDNLRHTVRFGAAVQAALEDGHRVFVELSPHPLLTYAIEQTAASLDTPAAALAAMRREQALPHGMRDLLAEVHSVGAAVDFSMLYPDGRLLDVPLPAWTHRHLLLGLDSRDTQPQAGPTVAVHPLLGSHVRLPEEPERHAWQAEVGTATLRWLADHRIHEVAALPAAAYCEIALTAAHTALGDASEVRDLRFDQMLLIEDETPVFALAVMASRSAAEFVVETFEEGERVRRATAILAAAGPGERPPAYDVPALLAARSSSVDGAELRNRFAERGVQYGPAFTGLTAAHTSGDTVLAEVALPGAMRSQQRAYRIHPALLDACFQSVGAASEIQNSGGGSLLLPLGVRRIRAYASARTAHYCYTRVTSTTATGFEADLDVLNEHGAVLLSIQGLQMGTGASEEASRDRALNERLLTVEWHRQELTEVDPVDAGTWLLVSTSAMADVAATELTDSLKLLGADCTSIRWSSRADPVANGKTLRDQLRVGRFTGVVLLTGPKDGDRDDECAARGGEYVRHVAHIVRELAAAPGEPPRLYVVTRNAQTVLEGDGANLEQGGLRGLLRVIGNEYPQFRTTQIDTDMHTGASLIARQLVSGSEEDETAWRNDEWLTARLRLSPLRPDERRTAVVDHEHDGMRLHIRAPGDLQTMELVACERIPPGPGQIEVAVTASSINFADVLLAFGRHPSFEGRLPQLGTDFAGMVTAVGPDVIEHKIGDHVGGLCPNGCWGTFVTCDANVAVTLPPGLTDAQAAAVTTAHATAWYGLHDLARVKAGDKVLIHSATGGVGQAAIAIARAAGAEIFATAGSSQRRKMLHDKAIEHVYDSRSVEFAEQIRRDTDGYGVDVVLNSLTGAAQLAGLKLLAPGGRFIEIGKRDIYGDTKLGLFPFRRNLAFYGVDLGLMSVDHPLRVRELLDTAYERVADGLLPMPASTHYPLTDAATAIRVMSAAEHTGKLVLDVARSGKSSAVLHPDSGRVFRPDGSYIITGGLGGIGLFLAEKLAAAGCGRIVLSSRSEPNQRVQEMIELVRAIGSDVVVECADITQPGTAERLVAAATTTGLPVRGVLHAAGVVEDSALGGITGELLERCWAPKVVGAWNLHRVTAGEPLDWFCLFSSAAALVGSPGQGAYAAANSWLDAFTHWRRAQGLPATAIAWGAWSELGRATGFAEDVGTAITPDEGAYAFQALLCHDRAYTGYAPVIDTAWLSAFAERSRFAEAFRSTGKSPTGTTRFLAELNTLPHDQWPTRLRRLVSEQVSLILRRTVDPDRPLSEYGLDSLGNLELRTRIEAEAGVRIKSTAITTVRGLAAHLCDTLAEAAPTSQVRAE